MRCVKHIELLLRLHILLSVMRPSVFANWRPRKLGSYSLQRQRDGVSPSMFTFQEIVSRSLRKTFPGCITGKKIGDDLYTLQRGSE